MPTGTLSLFAFNPRRDSINDLVCSLMPRIVIWLDQSSKFLNAVFDRLKTRKTSEFNDDGGSF